MQIALSESLVSRWRKTETENENKPWAQIQYMPLEDAYLCQDCETVGNSAHRCPACASKVLMCLAGVLNRKQVFQGALAKTRVA